MLEIDWAAYDGSHAYNVDNMALMATMPDNWADVAIIDPEYGIDAGLGIGRSNRLRIGDNKKDWDSKGIPGPEFFKEVFRVSQHQIIWGGNYFLDYLRASRCFYVWDKCNAGRDFADCEMAWVSYDAVARMVKYRVANDSKERFHSTQKPVFVYRWLYEQINAVLKPGRRLRIIDTNLGSGTNRIAAEEYGHIFVGAETDVEVFRQAEDYYKLKLTQVKGKLWLPQQETNLSTGEKNLLF